jgi:protein arginine kinase activator
MKCDFCTAKATVFLTQIVNGEMKKISLCDSCAEEKGVTDPTGFSLADMVFGNTISPITSSFLSSNQQFSGANSAKKCPVCDFSLDDLNRVRRFGCSECYNVFRSEIELILQGMHQGTSHLGKKPHHFAVKYALDEKLETLRDLLEKAISAEKYEAAAALRDEILQCENSAASVL